MCNKIHTVSYDVPKEGTGYKLFVVKTVEGKECLASLIGVDVYTSDYRGWITWKRKKGTALKGNVGFNFFLTEEEAVRAYRAWTQWLAEVRIREIICVKPVAYKGGICQQDEKAFVAPHTFRVALCKKFKVVEEVKDIARTQTYPNIKYKTS